MGAKEAAPSSVLSSYPVAAGDESAAKLKKEKKDKKGKKEKKKAKHDSAIPPEVRTIRQYDVSAAFNRLDFSRLQMVSTLRVHRHCYHPTLQVRSRGT
jgi:hypothetical protein